jgi:hypothetical protein
MRRKVERNNCVQAEPDYAFLVVVAQAPGAPGAEHYA